MEYKAQAAVPSALLLALTLPSGENVELGGGREPGTPSTFSAHLASSQYVLSRNNTPSPHPTQRDSSSSGPQSQGRASITTPKADVMALPPSPPLTLQRIPSQDNESSPPRKHHPRGEVKEEQGLDLSFSAMLDAGPDSKDLKEDEYGAKRLELRDSTISVSKDTDGRGSGEGVVGLAADRASNPNSRRQSRSSTFGHRGEGTEPPSNRQSSTNSKRITPTFREEFMMDVGVHEKRRASRRSSRRSSLSREVAAAVRAGDVAIEEDDVRPSDDVPGILDVDNSGDVGRRRSGSVHRLTLKTGAVDDVNSIDGNGGYMAYDSSVGHSDFGKKSWTQPHPQIPRSSYYVGPPPLGSAFGTNPMGEIGVHFPREIVRIERDYSAGELVQFYPTFPLEFEGRVTPTQFQETINEINEVLISAHSLKASAWENVLGVATMYLSLLFLESHYSKEMRRLARLIDQFNAEVFNPSGLNILWPRKTAFMFMEIEYY